MEREWSTVNSWFTFEHFNIAPSHMEVPVVALNRDGERCVQMMHWPLRPVWSKGETVSYKTHNARSETMQEKSSFKLSWSRGWRCLVPMVGFYEWQVVEGQKIKQPWFICLPDHPQPAMAGLWCSSKTPEGEAVLSFTIITLSANELMAKISNDKKRMPLILKPEDYNTWLGGSVEEASALVQPYPSARMEAWPVGTYINRPDNNDEQCMEAVNKKVVSGQ